MNIDQLKRVPTFSIKFSPEGITFITSKKALLGSHESLIAWDKIEAAEIKKRLGMTYLSLKKKNSWFKWAKWHIPLTGPLWEDIAKGIKVHAPNGHPLRKLKALSGETSSNRK